MLLICRSIAFPLLILMLFPWIQITGYFPSDIQPYSLFCGLLLLGALLLYQYLQKPVISRCYLPLVYSSIVACCIFILFVVRDGISFEVLRAGYQYIYLTVFFLITAIWFSTGLHKKSDFHLLHLILLACFTIWVIVGLIQRFFDQEFLVSLVGRSVVTEDRGAVSLSSEPAYFGHVLIFFGIAFFLLGRKIAAFLSWSLVPILTMSSVAIVVTILLFFLYFLFKSNLRFFLSFLLFASALLFAGQVLTSHVTTHEYRVLQILHKVYNEPLLLITDGSLNIRLTHLYYSHLGFLESKGLPHGPISWPSYISMRIGDNPIFWDAGLQQTHRINSGIGGLIFEGGWLSVFLIILVIITLKRLVRIRTDFFLAASVFFVLFYTGYTFKTPFFYIIIFIFCMRNFYSKN